MGELMESDSVREDQMEQIQRWPEGSPVMTREEQRSSTMTVGSFDPLLFWALVPNPSLEMLIGGKSPLLRFSLNISR